MPRKISIRIDGEYVNATDDQTILQAARANNKFIPALCYMNGLSATGACRLCIVEVAGIGRLLAACTTTVQDGMSVTTNSQTLLRYRRIALELLFAERNHICSVCVTNNHCELQALARKLGVTSVRYAYNYPILPADVSHDRFVLDQNRCVLCGRCVRVCGEVEGAHVWDFMSRGISSRLVAEMNQPWGLSRNCTNCAKCVQACPTGAMAEKGWAVEEMIKTNENISRLASKRGAQA